MDQIIKAGTFFSKIASEMQEDNLKRISETTIDIKDSSAVPDMREKYQENLESGNSIIDNSVVKVSVRNKVCEIAKSLLMNNQSEVLREDFNSEQELAPENPGIGVASERKVFVPPPLNIHERPKRVTKKTDRLNL